MDDLLHIDNLDDYNFSDTSFNKLMQRRIRKILLICSSYDAFMLEEDGRIDEQIFNEYASLSLRYPPVFIHADSYQKAFKILENGSIDLVIEMLSTGDIDPFQLARRIKENYAEIPIVVLTHFSREVSLKLEKEDLSAIDYVFSWLGNADLLLAIIKLIEDKMNAKYDIDNIGVQAILLVEDSIRYMSTYLPTLYKLIFVQSREFMKEALNEHQKMLRMRGRPKILLATNYEDAINLYKSYKDNLLGVISDVSYKLNPQRRDTKLKAGLRLARYIKSDNEFTPILLQSSDSSNAELAKKLGVAFINKYSKNLSIELKEYINRYFVFGEFVFRNPKTQEEVAVATDLQSFQQMLCTIPDDVFLYHTSRNDFTKWLNARGLFKLASLFKDLKVADFNNIEEARNYIYKAIAVFRTHKSRGVIAQFDKERFDEYMEFTRIGDGSIGGKARGLAFTNNLIKKHKLHHKYEDAFINIPRTVVISTDVFEEFMETNNLYEIAVSNSDDQTILDNFVAAKLPETLISDLKSIVSVIKNPIAVRSSSKLEDSHYQPFAGIYSTYMVPMIENNQEKSVKLLCEAIKAVYASVYYKSSKAYMAFTANVIDEEKMGIILQEVCGKKIGNYFYPAISGVARSVNFYPIEPEKSTEGIVNIAYGLGKYIVEGSISLRFAPKYPQKILQLSSPEMALKDTQKYFFALDLSADSFSPSLDDAVNLKKLKLKDGKEDPNFKHVTSTYDHQSNILRDGTGYEGWPVITFSNVLNHNVFPLAKILDELLTIGHREMNNPIEIEFAVDLATSPEEINTFNFLQIRPIVYNEQSVNYHIENVDKNKAVVFSNKALGNGLFGNVRDVIFVKPDVFDSAKTKDIAVDIEKINIRLQQEDKNYILIGPGRWGSSDPWLGIPVKWPHISQAKVIIEAGLENYRIEPSQGTHFFQNLTSFQVGYLTVNPHENDGLIDYNYLDTQTLIYEDEFLKQVSFEKPLKIQIDGKNNIGVIYKQ